MSCGERERVEHSCLMQKGEMSLNLFVSAKRMSQSTVFLNFSV